MFNIVQRVCHIIKLKHKSMAVKKGSKMDVQLQGPRQPDNPEEKCLE